MFANQTKKKPIHASVYFLFSTYNLPNTIQYIPHATSKRKRK